MFARIFFFSFQPDDDLVGQTIKGPSYTPKNLDYEPLIGRVVDVTDKFDRTFMDINFTKTGKMISSKK